MPGMNVVTHEQTPASRPRLPLLLAQPLALAPVPVLFAKALNVALAGSVRSGELEFLRGRRLALHVRDANLVLNVSLNGQRLAADTHTGPCDLKISGDLYDFFVLVGRQVDPDTLFFQRRLGMEGDTALGLEVKNFLDAFDAEAVPFYPPLNFVLQRLLPVYRRLF